MQAYNRSYITAPFDLPNMQVSIMDLASNIFPDQKKSVAMRKTLLLSFIEV